MLKRWKHRKPKNIIKSSRFSVCFRGISRLGSAFIHLRWFNFAHIYNQATSLHRWNKQGIYRKFLRGNGIHMTQRIVSPIVFKYSTIWIRCKDWRCVVSREFDFLLKICDRPLACFTCGVEAKKHSWVLAEAIMRKSTISKLHFSSVTARSFAWTTKHESCGHRSQRTRNANAGLRSHAISCTELVTKRRES